MSKYGWKDCPSETKAQIHRLVDELAQLLSENLQGIYLHGSLAMGCFNPRRSDLDLLVVTCRPMGLDSKKALARLLLKESRAPHPVEISFLPCPYLIPWQYPTPFDFHYSETWRETMLQEFESGAWMRWNDQTRTDPDLAAHVTITKQRGLCLFGNPIMDVMPEVPAGGYLASILGDIRESLDGCLDDPIYSILNICRVYAFKQDGLVTSKVEGGLWALKVLPDEFHPVINQALERYASPEDSGAFDLEKLAGFIALMRSYLLN